MGTDPEGVSQAELIVLWGSNIAATGPHLLPMIKQARSRGASLVTIDPRPSRSTRLSDAHLAVRPGTDGMLALGVMRLLIEEGYVDQDYVRRGTIGFDALAEHVRPYTPEVVAAETGLTVGQVLWFGRLYGAKPRSFVRLGWGMQRYSNGGMAVRAITCLPALTGAWKYPGGGVLLSNMDSFPINKAALTRPDLAAGPVREVNMVELGDALTRLDPPIRALYVYNSNPAAVAPDQEKVIEGLRREDLFPVVHEVFPTDSVDYADVVLPATTMFESLDLHTAMGYYLNLNMPAISLRGEARSNHHTFAALARAMGWSESCWDDRPEDVVEQATAGTEHWEHATLDYLREKGFARARTPDNPHLPFADGVFRTSSGKCELYSERMLADGYPALPTYEPLMESPRRSPEVAERYPLTLISPATAVTTSSSHANLVPEMADPKRAVIEISPQDAARRGLAEGDLVRVFNDRGACLLYAKLVEDLQPGVAVTAKVRWPKLGPGHTNVNFTTSQRLSDMGGGATFHENRVELAPA